MAEKVLTEFKQQVKSFELEPSGGGCFELTVNDDVVYSKLSTGEFPNEFDLIAKLREG